MGIFLVERYLPGIDREGLALLVGRLESTSARLRGTGADVRYLGSLFLPEEESCFCRVEAASAEAAARLNELAEAPYARISPALALGPHAGATASQSRITADPGTPAGPEQPEPPSGLRPRPQQ